jgi:tetratricopeptide (TPR) repeat protein
MRSGKLAALSVLIALVVTLSCLDWVSIRERIPPRLPLQAGLVFVNAMRAAHGLVLLAVAILIPTLSGVCFSRRRRGKRSPRTARILLCAISLLIALLAAEALVLVRERSSWPTLLRDAPDAPEVVANHDSSGDRLPPPEEPRALPERFPDADLAKGIDLVVLGESSAEGVPFQRWLSIGAIVKWQLEKLIPGQELRLKILACSGDTLEQQHQALARLKRRPEILIVYCGHNEFASRFFALADVPHYFRDERPSTWSRLIEPAERLSPLCGLLRRSAERIQIALPPPPIERDVIDVPVFTRQEYSRILSDFRRRLEAIVAYAKRVGALPILISPSANDADFEPNRSYLPPETSLAERRAFARAVLAARTREAADPEGAIEDYRHLLARAPGFAETHYRLATLLRKSGDWEGAYHHFVSARDLDGYPMRCLTEFQETYRDVASRDDCIFIDGQAYFHRIGRNGMLDDELFQDAMHPSLRGQIALAQAVVSAIGARRAFGWPADTAPEAIDPTELATHFGLGRDTWEHAARWESGFYSLVGRLRYESSERSRRIDAAAFAADKIAKGSPPESLHLPNVGIPAPIPLGSGEGRKTVERKPAKRNG